MTLRAGYLRAWKGGPVPADYLPCDGRAVSRRQYPALFAVIGTEYGTAPAGTFRLPDLRRTVHHSPSLPSPVVGRKRAGYLIRVR
jgi:microcystin-dependent protein